MLSCHELVSVALAKLDGVATQAEIIHIPVKACHISLTQQKKCGRAGYPNVNLLKKSLVVTGHFRN